MDKRVIGENLLAYKGTNGEKFQRAIELEHLKKTEIMSTMRGKVED